MSLVNSKEFILYNSNADSYITIFNLAAFCKENKLTESCLRDVTAGRQKQHKGYYLKKENVKEKNIKPKLSKKLRYIQTNDYEEFLLNILKYYNLYMVEQKLTCKQIGNLFNRSAETIRYNFKKHNLPILNNYNSTIKRFSENWNNCLKEKQKILFNNFKDIFNDEHHIQKLDVHVIAKKYNTNTTTIFNYCRLYNIPYRRANISKPHSKIEDFLTLQNIKFKTNYRRGIPPRELDIFINPLAIEINGIYWHTEEKVGKKYHYEKYKECADKNIDLIQFWDTEIRDNWEICKSIISTRLNLLKLKVYARKCIIKQVQYKEIKQFLNENHIQGERTSSINYAVYYNNEIVHVQTYNKHKKYGYELIRLCTKLNTIAIGCAQKCMNQFIKDYNPKQILSFCDIRLFKGDIYTKLGFELSHISNPNYFYIDYNGNKLHSRIAFQKHKLADKLEFYDKDLTEWENMKLNKYVRIFDCGNKVFVKTL